MLLICVSFVVTNNYRWYFQQINRNRWKITRHFASNRDIIITGKLSNGDGKEFE